MAAHASAATTHSLIPRQIVAFSPHFTAKRSVYRVHWRGSGLAGTPGVLFLRPFVVESSRGAKLRPNTTCCRLFGNIFVVLPRPDGGPRAAHVQKIQRGSVVWRSGYGQSDARLPIFCRVLADGFANVTADSSPKWTLAMQPPNAVRVTCLAIGAPPSTPLFIFWIPV